MTTNWRSSDRAKPCPTPPDQGSEELVWLDELTPRQIVAELDKYIVGQDDAKKAVAIVLRNRWRRQRVEDEMRDEIAPNNLILIGPTGVGKTEIARRLARLAGAPFLKVEASKFTEVGYVGRDVESMIRDLVDISINLVRADREYEVQGSRRGARSRAAPRPACCRSRTRSRRARRRRARASSWPAPTGGPPRRPKAFRSAGARTREKLGQAAEGREAGGA